MAIEAGDTDVEAGAIVNNGVSAATCKAADDPAPVLISAPVPEQPPRLQSPMSQSTIATDLTMVL
jgi:hypothetical protein